MTFRQEIVQVWQNASSSPYCVGIGILAGEREAQR
jgi:hypothetical protein